MTRRVISSYIVAGGIAAAFSIPTGDDRHLDRENNAVSDFEAETSPQNAILDIHRNCFYGLTRRAPFAKFCSALIARVLRGSCGGNASLMKMLLGFLSFKTFHE